MWKAIKTRTPNHHRRGAGVATLLLAMALPSCTTTTGDEPSDPPLATLVAEHASELGVATWEVRTEGETTLIIGLDEHATRQAEMIVRRIEDNPDRVQIEAVLPEHGVFELGRGGIVDGAPSEVLQRLGVAVSADLGERSAAIAPGPGAGLGTATSALSLQNEGHIYMGWSLFGYSANVDVGWICWQGDHVGTRSYASAYSDNGSSCWVNRWISDWSGDCRINVHYGIGGGRTDVCNWFVYVE